jgi:hypothetical protein
MFGYTPPSDYDRRLAAVMAAYERKVHDIAEPEIAARLEAIRPGDTIPIIGGTFPDYELLSKEDYREEMRGLIANGTIAPPKIPSKAEYCKGCRGTSCAQ